MDRRTLFFVIAVSWVFVIYMLMTGPGKNKDGDQNAENNDAAQNQKDGDQDDSEEKKESGKSEKEGDPKQKQSDDKNNPDKKGSNDPGNQSENDGKTSASSDGKSGSKKGDSPQTESNLPDNVDGKTSETQDPPEKKRRTLPQQFVSIGTLAKDSQYRFLATFDTTAASVHRLELIQRHRKSEKFRYKDLEIRYGYIGHLDLTSVESGGCRVGTVGKMTPADLAGIKVGDIINRFNDVEIETRLDFQKALRDTRPGQTVKIELTRGAEKSTAEATLLRQPLEIIKPARVPEEFDRPFQQIRDQRMSYATTLFNPDGRKWEKIGDQETENWEPEIEEGKVTFYYPYRDQEECRKAGFDYQAVKSFRLIPVEEGNQDNVTDMSYHLDFDFAVINLSEESRYFAYRVDGPNGLPTEDWWFAIKIHGEWSAMFSQAGARDIVASTNARNFLFIGGPKIYSNATSKNQMKSLDFIDPAESGSDLHALRYVGVDSHYFVSALIPTDGESKTARQAYSGYALPQWIPLFQEEGGNKIDPQLKKEARWYRKLVPVNYKVYFEMDNPSADGDDSYLFGPGQSSTHSFMIFAGPKEPGLLKKYEIGDCVTYGWFAAFSWPLVSILHLFYAVVGNYAIAIILLTILVRLAMMRFSRKMVLNSQMMQLLAPEIKAIAERYKDDFQAKSRAQQELFRKYNYNPFSGCFVMLIQLPVFIGLYRGLSVDIALRDKALIPGVSWCSNLAGPDQLWNWNESLPSFFSFLTHETGFLGPYFNLLPIFSVVLMLIQQKLFTPPPADEQQAFMQKVMSFMMIFIGILFFKVPAGLCIYFITSTLWAILEKKLVPPPKLPEHLQKRLDELKELQAKEKADGVTPGTYTTPASNNSSGKKGIAQRAKKKNQKNRRK